MASPIISARAGRATSRIMRTRERPTRPNTPAVVAFSAFVSGDVLASGVGTTFRAFSLITLSSDGFLLVRIAGDCGAQVVFHQPEFLEHALDRPRRNAVEDGFHHVVAQIRQAVEQRLRSRF